MRSFEKFPSDIVETSEGDVISRADYESNEGILHEAAEDTFSIEAAAVAGGIIDAGDVIVEYGDPEALARLNETSPATENQPTLVTQRYDRLMDEVEKLVDKQIDRKVAEYQLDPTGEIRREYHKQEAARQASLNHLMIDDMRKRDHDAAMAKINDIADPVERKRAEAELLAKERIAERKRQSRA